jgi:hypothetical protein
MSSFGSGISDHHKKMFMSWRTIQRRFNQGFFQMIHWFQRRRCLKHLNGGDLDILYFCEQRGNDPSNKV